jgi:hypothetical protein
LHLFTDIVSLGHRCRTTRQLRNHFGTEAAYPFDWWISSMKGLSSLLADWNVDRLFHPDELAEFRVEGRIFFVRQRRYGLKLFHDFPMQAAVMQEDWRDHIDEAKSKTLHLMRKFDGLNQQGRRILFIREVGGMDKRPEFWARALKTAVRAHVPNAKSSFVMISPNGLAIDGWTSLTIDDPVEEPWTGTDEIWRGALASLDYALAP